MLALNDAAVMLALAIVMDLLLGEPPAAIHPVVWMGRWIHWWERRAPSAPAVPAYVDIATQRPAANARLVEAVRDLRPVAAR